MKFYCHIFLLSLSVTFLAMTGFISYTYYDDIYFNCDVYNCTYSKLEDDACKITIKDKDIICTQSHCKRDFPNGVLDFISPCYLPKGRIQCPMNECYSKEHIYDMMCTIFVTILNVFFIVMVMYYGIKAILKYRRHKQQYESINNKF